VRCREGNYVRRDQPSPCWRSPRFLLQAVRFARELAAAAQIASCNLLARSGAPLCLVVQSNRSSHQPSSAAAPFKTTKTPRSGGPGASVEYAWSLIERAAHDAEPLLRVVMPT